MLSEFGLDGLYAVDSALPIVDKVADGPLSYFFPEGQVPILDSIGEVRDIFFYQFGVTFLHKNSVDILWIGYLLLFFITMDQSGIPFCSMTDPFEIMTGHNDYIVYLECIDQVDVFLGGFYELYPSAELILNKGIISQHSVAPVPLGVSSLEHFYEVIEFVDTYQEVRGEVDHIASLHQVRHTAYSGTVKHACPFIRVGGDLPLYKLERFLKEIRFQQRSTSLIALVVALPLKSHEFGKANLSRQTSSKGNGGFTVDETVLQVPFVFREDGMHLLGSIMSETPRLIEGLVSLHRLLHKPLNLGVLLSGLLDLIAVMCVPPPSPHTHVLPLTLSENLEDGDALKVTFALDDGGLIDDLEDRGVIVSPQDEVYLWHLLRQLQICRHPCMGEGDDQFAAQFQQCLAHLPRVLHDVEVLQLLGVGRNELAVEVRPRESHEADLHPAVLLDVVIQSLPYVQTGLQVLDVAHQPGALGGLGQFEGVFGREFEVMVAVAGDIYTQQGQAMSHLLALECLGQFGGSEGVTREDKEGIGVSLTQLLDIVVEIEEAELS